MSAQLKQRFFPFALAANEPQISIAGLQAVAAGMTVNQDANPTLEQQLADAFNANNRVMAYVAGIANTTLPTIPAAPDWYIAFETTFSNIQIHANGWYPIATNLVSIPNSIVGYGIAFNVAMSTINGLIPVLQKDPANQAARTALCGQLQGMITTIRGFSTAAQGLNQSIATFSNGLHADAAVLAAAVADSIKTQEVDQEKVKGFVSDIAELKREIDHWQTVETATAIAAGVSFWLGAVIAIFTLGIGLAFGIISTAALITTAVIASQKVQAARDAVRATQLKMNAVTQQAASLAALNVQIENLMTLSEAAGAQVALVLQVWDQLESELAAVVADLGRSEADVTNMDLAQLQKDLNSANHDWQTVIATSSVIAAIKYNQATPATANL